MLPSVADRPLYQHSYLAATVAVEKLKKICGSKLVVLQALVDGN